MSKMAATARMLVLLTAGAGALACGKQVVGTDGAAAANITSVQFTAQGTGTGGTLAVGVHNVGTADLTNLSADVRYYSTVTGQQLMDVTASAAATLKAGASETLYSTLLDAPPSGACVRATLTGQVAGSGDTSTLDSTYSTCP